MHTSPPPARLLCPEAPLRSKGGSTEATARPRLLSLRQGFTLRSPPQPLATRSGCCEGNCAPQGPPRGRMRGEHISPSLSDTDPKGDGVQPFPPLPSAAAPTVPTLVPVLSSSLAGARAGKSFSTGLGGGRVVGGGGWLAAVPAATSALTTSWGLLHAVRCRLHCSWPLYWRCQLECRCCCS
jgi:hypothetical protein